MDAPTSRYCCPACDRAILNRKIDKCLFCGAALPAALLLAPETIAELNRQQQALEPQRQQHTTQSSSSASDSSGLDLGDAIDVIDIAADVVDIAGNIFSGLGSLLE